MKEIEKRFIEVLNVAGQPIDPKVASNLSVSGQVRILPYSKALIGVELNSKIEEYKLVLNYDLVHSEEERLTIKGNLKMLDTLRVSDLEFLGEEGSPLPTLEDLDSIDESVITLEVFRMAVKYIRLYTHYVFFREVIKVVPEALELFIESVTELNSFCHQNNLPKVQYETGRVDPILKMLANNTIKSTNLS